MLERVGKREAWGAGREGQRGRGLCGAASLLGPAHPHPLATLCLLSMGRMHLCPRQTACTYLGKGQERTSALGQSGCCNKNTIDSGFHNTPLFFSVLETGKSKIRAPADPVPGEGLLPGSCCVLAWWKGQGSSEGPLL